MCPRFHWISLFCSILFCFFIYKFELLQFFLQMNILICKQTKCVTRRRLQSNEQIPKLPMVVGIAAERWLSEMFWSPLSVLWLWIYLARSHITCMRPCISQKSFLTNEHEPSNCWRIFFGISYPESLCTKTSEQTTKWRERIGGWRCHESF